MLTRRLFLGGTALTIAADPKGAVASVASEQAFAEVTKGASVRKGRVALTLPAIAENGLSVFTTIEVESPMLAADYVKAVHLMSEKNPAPVIASFFFTPAMARAKVSTNIRLAASQKITAIAVMSDGSLWADEKPIVVTIAACIDGG